MLGKLGGQCHGGGDETLHVARATPVNRAVADGHGKRVAGPVLIGDRDHVGVARQDNTAVSFGPERGEEVGFLAGRVGKHVNACARILQPVGKMVDQGEVAVGGHRGIGDQVVEQSYGVVERGHGQSFTNSFRSTEQNASAAPSGRISRVSVVSSPQPSIQRPGMKWKVMPGSSTVVSPGRIE